VWDIDRGREKGRERETVGEGGGGEEEGERGRAREGREIQKETGDRVREGAREAENEYRRMWNTCTGHISSPLAEK